MIIEYDRKYDNDIKDLLGWLQEYLKEIDNSGYTIYKEEFKECYFEKKLEEVKKYNGKIILYEEENKIVGLVIGCINNEEEETTEFKVPKRGRITELVVSQNSRSKGIGTILLKEMEKYLKSIGCLDILLGVLAYNEDAIEFYKKNGYHIHTIDVIKKDV